MTTQQGSRIIPPDEARKLLADLLPGAEVWSPSDLMAARRANGRLEYAARDLAHTAAVLGEQREAVLALHKPDEDGACECCSSSSLDSWVLFPCPTARALGVK